MSPAELYRKRELILLDFGKRESRPQGRKRAGVQVVITDLGGVLIDFRWPDDHEDFYSRCSASRESIGRFFRGGGEFSEYQRGKLETSGFFEVVRAELGFRDGFEEFRAAFCGMMPERFLKEDVYDLFFCDVKPRYAVEFWLLSNVNELHYEHIRAKAPGIFANCHEVFLSHEMGCAKPEDQIYRKALDAGGAPPHACFFVDDSEANVLAAKKLKIPSAQFKDTAKLKADLKVYCGIEAP